jgi:hypothetical protein
MGIYSVSYTVFTPWNAVSDMALSFKVICLCLALWNRALLEKLTFAESRGSPPFIEPEVLVQCAEELINDPCPVAGHCGPRASYSCKIHFNTATTVCWGATACSLTELYQFFWWTCYLQLEDRRRRENSTKILHLLTEYTTSRTKRQKPSYSPSWEPRTSQFNIILLFKHRHLFLSHFPQIFRFHLSYIPHVLHSFPSFSLLFDH